MQIISYTEKKRHIKKWNIINLADEFDIYPFH